jgi:spore germination cell wall hydrolase CwlJ-like protein
LARLVAVQFYASSNFLYTRLFMSFETSLMPAWQWRSRPLEITALALLGGAAVLAIAGVSTAMPTVDVAPKTALPATVALPSSPSATELRDVAPEEALALNARIPLSKLPTVAAPSFVLSKADAKSRAQALECLTSAIYYEAGQESDAGQRAVAQVILNRVRHPAYPSTICGVVFQGSTRVTGCQFTFTCDGSMRRETMLSAWNRAGRVAIAALAGSVYAPVGLATHYHANYVVPYWASSLVKTHVEGPHIFYRWAGGWGRPAAFQQRYSKHEPDARALRTAALSVEHVLPPAIAPGSDMAAVAALGAIDGVKVANSGAGVSVKFSMAAREAVEKVAAAPLVDRTDVSDNLRHALDGAGPTGAEAQPFGPSADAAGTPAQPK